MMAKNDHNNMPGTLYLIPNTLGSDEHQAEPLAHIIPQQVQSITAGLAYFVAENAKTTRAFLKLVALTQPLARPLQEITIAELNVNTDATALPALLAPILAGQDGGQSIDLGGAAFSVIGVLPPHQHGIAVKPLVGPSSLLLAVMASGLNGQSFAFNGYLPTDNGLRMKRLKELELRSRQERQTQLFIETPYRNAALLEAIIASCQPNTLVCVATDLSLASETIKTQSAGKWKSQLASGKAPDFHKKPTVFLLLAE